jgi:hypothetical protein
MSRKQAKGWFKPRRHLYGWAAYKPELARRRALGRRARVTNWLSAARALVALANVTRDARTRRVARADAWYAFERHRTEKYKKRRRARGLLG